MSLENGKLPLLRDVDASYYLRQEKSGLNLGPYERNCRAHWVTPDDPMPDDFHHMELGAFCLIDEIKVDAIVHLAESQ